MPNLTNPNLKLLAAVVARLGSFVDEVVFLGGCATGLLLSDPAAPPLRVTRDVDVMVEDATLSGYHNFNEKLRKRGFNEDTRPKAPIYRWQAEDLVLDVMPTNTELLGFGTRTVRYRGISGAARRGNVSDRLCSAVLRVDSGRLSDSNLRQAVLANTMETLATSFVKLWRGSLSIEWSRTRKSLLNL